MRSIRVRESMKMSLSVEFNDAHNLFSKFRAPDVIALSRNMVDGSERHLVPTASHGALVVGLFFLWEKKCLSPLPQLPHVFFTVGTSNIRRYVELTCPRSLLFDATRAGSPLISLLLGTTVVCMYIVIRKIL